VRLFWTPAAFEDLRCLYEYIQLDNPAAAKEQAKRIVSHVEQHLPRMPQIGRVGRISGTRELPIPETPYLVAYRIREGTIRILRVLHGAQKWPKRM
jgi:addiction module RelE/StbE family toxin